MDVVLASVVVMPGPGMIMFSLKTLLEPARKPFTEQEKAEKFVKLEELDGCRIKPTSYQGVQSIAHLFSVSLQNVLHLSLQTWTRTPAPPRVLANCRLPMFNMQINKELMLRSGTKIFLSNKFSGKEIDMKDEDYNCHIS